MFLTREESKLFDTKSWVEGLERGYGEAWRRWVLGWIARIVPRERRWEEWAYLGARAVRTIRLPLIAQLAQLVGTEDSVEGGAMVEASTERRSGYIRVGHL